MLRFGGVMPGDLDLPDFTAREFARFEKYVGDVDERERVLHAALTRQAVGAAGT